MKKLLTVGIVVVVTLALLASPAVAKGKNGPSRPMAWRWADQLGIRHRK
jgi:hypothetical protein